MTLAGGGRPEGAIEAPRTARFARASSGPTRERTPGPVRRRSGWRGARGPRMPNRGRRAARAAGAALRRWRSEAGSREGNPAVPAGGPTRGGGVLVAMNEFNVGGLPAMVPTANELVTALAPR